MKCSVGGVNLPLIVDSDDDVVLRHTLPIFTGLGRCPIVNWDFIVELIVDSGASINIIEKPT